MLGTVLCSPGCFSVYRAAALRDVLPIYCSEVKCASEFLTKDMGEDRWLCTLMVRTRTLLPSAQCAYDLCGLVLFAKFVVCFYCCFGRVDDVAICIDVNPEGIGNRDPQILRWRGRGGSWSLHVILSYNVQEYETRKLSQTDDFT